MPVLRRLGRAPSCTMNIPGARMKAGTTRKRLHKKQWAWKRQYALDARQQAQALKSDALKTVAATVPSNTFAIFNTCSWQRSDLVILPADLSRPGDVVRNALGKPVPSQRLADGSLAFLARNIPAMSSRKFTVAAGKSAYHGAATAGDGLLKTNRMSLRFDPQTGAITRWKVNGMARDLVNSGDRTCRGLNDYLYILGGDNGKVQYASDAKLTIVDAGPLVGVHSRGFSRAGQQFAVAPGHGDRRPGSGQNPGYV